MLRPLPRNQPRTPEVKPTVQARIEREVRRPARHLDVVERDQMPELTRYSGAKRLGADVGIAIFPEVVLPDAFMLNHASGPLLTGTTNYPMLARQGHTGMCPMFVLENGRFNPTPAVWFYRSPEDLPSFANKILPADFPAEPSSYFHHGPEVWAPEVKPYNHELYIRLETVPRRGDRAYVISGKIGTNPLDPKSFDQLVDKNGQDVALFDAVERSGKLISIIDATYFRERNGDEFIDYKEDRNGHGRESVIFQQRVRIQGNVCEKIGPPLPLLKSRRHTFEGNVVEGHGKYRLGDLRVLNYTGGNCFDGNSYKQAAAIVDQNGRQISRGGVPYMENDHPLVRASGLAGAGHTIAWTPRRDVRINGTMLKAGLTYQVGSAWPRDAQSSVWNDQRTPGIWGPVVIDPAGQMHVGTGHLRPGPAGRR